MTMIEILVAVMVLTFGLIGVATTVSIGQRTTRTNMDREQATALARDTLERARQFAYSELTDDNAGARFRAAVTGDAMSSSGVPFTVTRRQTSYTVNVSTCRIDDPADGVGLIDQTYCNYVGSTTTPAGRTTPAAVSATVKQLLGTNLNLGAATDGAALTAVCNALGGSATGALADALGASSSTARDALVLGGASLAVCPSGSSSFAIGFDKEADDFTQVTVNVSWTPQGGQSKSVSQSMLVPTT